MASAVSVAVCVCLQKTFEARSQAVGAGKGWTQGVAMLTASAVARAVATGRGQTKAQQGAGAPRRYREASAGGRRAAP
eukprot:5586519-Prymnesium_polylepis.1